MTRARWIVFALLCMTAAPVSAQLQTQLLDLNSEALDAYQNLDIDTAAAKLQEALGLAQQAGYAGPEVAQTFVNLGVVFVAGYNDFDQGLASFVSALCIAPDAQLDPLLSTPDVQQVFVQAQNDARAGACGPGQPAQGPAPGPQPNLMPGPQPGPTMDGAMDEECPPGMVCGGDGDDYMDPADRIFSRAFVNLQGVGGFAMVQSGMTADSDPPLSPDVPTLDINGDTLINDLDRRLEVFTPFRTEPFDANGDGVIDEKDMGAIQLDQRFDDRSAWVPDADSFDDFSTIQPVSPKCEADGTRTGPTDKIDTQSDTFFTDINPSSYCVRVERPGFVTNFAVRLNAGYFITERFALSVPFRFQFNAGEGSMSHMLIGLRGEFAFNGTDEATGFPVSLFFGGTYGQIQAKPPPKDPMRPAPYVISGPFGGHLGVNVRFRIHKHFGFILSPEFDAQFPDFLFNFDLAAGVEGAI